jgi:hypothetical protein
MLFKKHVFLTWKVTHAIFIEYVRAIYIYELQIYPKILFSFTAKDFPCSSFTAEDLSDFKIFLLKIFKIFLLKIFLKIFNTSPRFSRFQTTLKTWLSTIWSYKDSKFSNFTVHCLLSLHLRECTFLFWMFSKEPL